MEKIDSMQRVLLLLPEYQQYGGTMYHVAQRQFVHSGKSEDYNRQYCIDNKIPVYHIEREGGTIVSEQGDIAIINFSKVDNFRAPQFHERFMAAFLSYLVKEKAADAQMDGNDILVNSYKCASSSSCVIGNMLCCTIQISMSVDIDTIKNICQKPMRKKPKGLSELLSITTKEVEDFIHLFVSTDTYKL